MNKNYFFRIFSYDFFIFNYTKIALLQVKQQAEISLHHIFFHLMFILFVRVMKLLFF